ncbi:hypothetical protein BRC92_08980 [Halobacteriales archaeon QS_4_69_31]|nr:MAG: hypothetical protein BRC92_08980 [Halobacteriales archaeon QS_4_69_31]
MTAGSCYVCLPHLAGETAFVDRLEGVCGPVTVHPGPNRPDRETLKRVVGEYDVVVCGVFEEFDREVAEAADGLRALASLSAGLDHVDTAAFRERGVAVVGVEEANVVSVAEHALMLVLAVEKRLVESHRAVLDGEGRDGLAGRPRELQGKTVGVVGAGPIAHAVAERAAAFGTDVLVWTFRPENHGEFEALGAQFVADLADLVERADVVTLHLPLTEKTRSLVDLDLLAGVEADRHRTLVNTARAGIVDPAVLDRVGEGFVFDAAGLDVYPEDPPERERVYYTPHTAGVTREATARMRRELVENLAAALDGGGS